MSEAAPQEQIEAWRRNGAWRVDPARFRFLEALAARVPEQREAVQAVLRSRLETALADYAQRVAAVPPPAPVVRRKAETPLTPLGQLNAHIRAAAVARHGEEAPSHNELASVRRFRQSWDRQHTLERVEEAVARKPANAGPLNSHALVLNTLALMRELSPDYLRQFVAHVEALQFIEKAREQLPVAKPTKAKPAKKAHARKR